ncbi:polyprenyl synthetase family protein [Sanguibacter suaedae]|uniref:polyprenyl synthetase family protein n=1 Tax=Sanguibacter suaedae TaxID=2795737 RepID=UPI0027DDF717|nr:polyprenyl synthetase family protein [Sanguibacter suaedae]
MTPRDVLTAYLDEQVERATPYGRDYHDLWTAIRETTLGGKQLRPELLMGTYRLLGGDDHPLAATVGAAVELLHAAFVLHDDVIDHDDTRRGRPTVNGRFTDSALAAGSAVGRADALGAAAGILAGDLALGAAVRLVATSDAAPHARQTLLDLVDHALFATAAGELADVRYSLGETPVDLAAVITMEALKTAVYSFELPLQAGAVLAGAGPHVLEHLGRFGRKVGIAFQLLDDVQGVFGASADTGKSVLTDLREGKHTPLVTHARTTAAWAVLQPVLGDPELTEADVEDVRRALETSGSRAFVEDLADDYLRAARDLARGPDLPEGFDTWFDSMTEAFVRRVA